MYEHLFHYFGLRENPFHVSPDPRFYFPTRAHDAAISELQFGVDTRQGFIVLAGESGTGKTTVLNHFLNWLQERRQSSSYIFHSLLKPVELFEFILRDFGVSCASREKGELLDTLHQWLIKRHTMGDAPVLVIDEAQAISVRTLDQIRLLLNLETPGSKLLQIVLAGQPELEEKLRRPELRQLRQRVMFRCNLLPLSLEETSNYVKSRLASAGPSEGAIFTEESLEAAHMYARGIPRTVNLLCEHALIVGYADQVKVITPEMIRRVAADFDLTPQTSLEEDLGIGGRFGRLVPFRPETRTPRVAAELEYLEGISSGNNGNAEQAPEALDETEGVEEFDDETEEEEIELSALRSEEPIADSQHPIETETQNVIAQPTESENDGHRASQLVKAGVAAAAASSFTLKNSNDLGLQVERVGTSPAAEITQALAAQMVATHLVLSHPATVLVKPANPVAAPQAKPVVQKPREASAQGPRVADRLREYWKAVRDSFLSDWKELTKGWAKPSNPKTAAPTNFSKNVVAPVSKWLREPTGTPPRRGKNRPQPPAGRKRRRR